VSTGIYAASSVKQPNASLMASSNSSSATPVGVSSFAARVQDIKFNKALINKLIMEYFVREGFPQSALQFSREANIDPGIETATVQERVEIRNCIHAGEIQTAIEKIIAIDPQLLDSDPSLHFALLRLQLIELIRPAIANPERNMQAALEFAEEELAPRAPANPQFLKDLEETMTLLIFKPGGVHASLAHLLEPKMRRHVAVRVNESILLGMGDDQRARLYDLIKAREWSELQARQAKKDIPERLDVGLNPASADDGDSIMQMGGNGQVDGSSLMVS